MKNNIKKLYKSSRDKVFFGVCGGLAKYFDISSFTIRMIIVLLTIASGWGIVVYFVLLFLIPEDPQKLKKEGEEIEKLVKIGEKLKEEQEQEKVNYKNILSKKLKEAADNGNLEIIKNTIREISKTKVNLDEDLYESLKIAASNGHLDVVKELVRAGAKVNNISYSMYFDDDDLQPLELASQNGHLDVVKELVRAGAKIKNYYSDIAYKNGNIKVAKELIKNGARDIIYKELRIEIEKMPIYKNWQKEVFKKYGRICQACGVKENLEIHHRQSMYSIIKINNIDTTYKAINCKELWNIENGIVLCIKCHKEMESSKKYNKLNQ
jgi:phage shock protein C